MNDRSAEYLWQMREHADYALSLVEGLQKEAFLRDRRTQQAVLMSLLVMGEAAARMIEHHSDVVARYRSVPWESIRAVRNRIAHGYLSIDLHVVWDTVQDALPDIRKALDDIT